MATQKQVILCTMSIVQIYALVYIIIIVNAYNHYFYCPNITHSMPRNSMQAMFTSKTCKEFTLHKLISHAPFTSNPVIGCI